MPTFSGAIVSNVRIGPGCRHPGVKKPFQMSPFHLDRLNRKMKALLAGAVTGAAMLALVQYVVLPNFARDLTPSQRTWLRDLFMAHMGWFLFGMIVLAAIFALPVLLVALWMSRRRT